ncbi:Uncharacterized protein BP5553_09382 [Venustampulla echinocandica]|uniref:Uncharacterized protein n=1 Tax=Venustampulla echinocandica TaxID=2656787 RepID=A0A370TCI6_9HELO|nr:Uncharacterized protein BP5553_09382 [Venustampulla echinocandica]RDL31980.1 Uncharacterized protein BP5553_09382 [Venustampulla echinocandica]
MGMWPFRRRSNRQPPRGGTKIPRSDGDTMHSAGTQLESGRHSRPEIASAGPERRMSRKDERRRSSRESNKLKRNPERRRTYSFSPGRRESIGGNRDEDRPPVPQLPSGLKRGAVRATAETPITSAAHQNPVRSSTQTVEPRQGWQRVPTLHKRSAQELARRKSSKKRKGDHGREAEIRAMAAFVPTRSAAEPHSSGRLMKRESQRMRTGLNHNLENPSSDISLPLAESLRSSLSSGSLNHASYNLSAFDVLAPRPTIRYSENPKYAPGASLGTDSPESRRRRVSDRKTLPDEVLRANRRIDELADDLSAGELRELMERDQKRRDKKVVAERMKVERKLARRQEKQRQEEVAAARDGTPPPDVMERGVVGREVVGLGIGTSAVMTSTKRKGSRGSDSRRGKRPAETFRQDSTIKAQDTVGNTRPTASPRTENLTSGSERSDPAIETATVGTLAKASTEPTASSKHHAQGPSNISQLMDLDKPEAPAPSKPEPPSFKLEPPRKSSEGSFRGPQSWTSFFKRSKNKRDSAPSSFSNTSRDSMPNHQATSFTPSGYTSVWASSNVPKRTMSKFREDLPELPISPPDSRVQSPEADVVPPIRTDYPDKKMGNRASAEDPRVRYDTPNSGYRSLETARIHDETPTSGHRSIEAPSPEPTAALSQSLASIDSEGSWLSGGKAGSRGGSKRTSAQLPPPRLRDSASSLQKRYKEYSESAEELGIAEDEYFSRLTPGPDEDFRRSHRQSTGNPMPSSDEEDGGSIASPVPSEQAKWGAVGRHPTVIHREPRAKSTEGLLNQYERDSFSDLAGDSPQPKTFDLNNDVINENEPGIHRATSVEYGPNHARRVSAGSARLLDLKPRVSGESKRRSAS